MKRLILPAVGIVVLVVAAVLYVSLALPVYNQISSLDRSISELEAELEELEATTYSMDDLALVNSEVADFDYEAYAEVRAELYEYYEELFEAGTAEAALQICDPEIAEALDLGSNPDTGVMNALYLAPTAGGKFYAMVDYTTIGPRGLLAIYSFDSTGTLVLEDAFSLLVG